MDELHRDLNILRNDYNKLSLRCDTVFSSTNEIKVRLGQLLRCINEKNKRYSVENFFRHINRIADKIEVYNSNIDNSNNQIGELKIDRLFTVIEAIVSAFSMVIAIFNIIENPKKAKIMFIVVIVLTIIAVHSKLLNISIKIQKRRKNVIQLTRRIELKKEDVRSSTGYMNDLKDVSFAADNIV